MQNANANVITCAGCGENYIDQTGDTLQHRMTVHRQQYENQNINVPKSVNIFENVQKTLIQILLFFHFTNVLERSRKQSGN